MGVGPEAGTHSDDDKNRALAAFIIRLPEKKIETLIETRCQSGHGKAVGGLTLEQTERATTKLRQHGESLPQEEGEDIDVNLAKRKMMTIMRNIDEMEHTKKAVKKRVGGKRRHRSRRDDERSRGKATQELRGRVNVISKTCIHEGCKTTPTYNYESKTNALHCSVHKKGGMINVISKTCKHEGCKTQPSFNFENETKALFCCVHREDGMVNVKN